MDSLEQLAQQVDSPSWFAIALVSVLGGAVRGATGFGGAMVMNLPLSLILGPSDAILTTMLLELAGPLGAARKSWNRIAQHPTLREHLYIMSAAALASVPVFLLLRGQLDAEVVAITMACAILAAALIMVVRLPTMQSFSRVGSGIAGAISGASCALTGVGGPPVVLYVVACERNHKQSRNLLMLYITFLSLLVIVLTYLLLPMTTRPFWLALLLAPTYWIGIFAGSRLALKMSSAHLSKLTLSLVALGSLIFLIKKAI